MEEHKITFYNLEANTVNYSETIKVNEPRKCMHCGNTGKQLITACLGTLGKYDEYPGIITCACQYCGSTTIHFMYTGVRSNPNGYETEKFLISSKTIPSEKETPLVFPKSLSEKFSNFIEIYNQSQEAEEMSLDKIAGMGYRKALEFLVTDFLLQYPVDGVTEEWLTNPKITLGTKISKIENPRLQDLSKAISYLGNDETHYSRQHPEHDINSIKAFINVLVSEIDKEVVYAEAKKVISKPKEQR
ncbi:DUF4145 domain-containing protein [Enterococcus sp. BWR-S5]|uniref:DUF4145 domain-containing protein n=1 Tax=Enterococcus sp. BWR-S5 TaxID=2787714 RepID=UPI001923AC74|nr:DUF4145 domain-containing protein [Enterococcus sp. BWR-S5]MBL1224805.1 DUF4145 domain-containing protein [Enterococcus sp. BWR-S5]